jgi:hypothetical protein
MRLPFVYGLFTLPIHNITFPAVFQGQICAFEKNRFLRCMNAAGRPAVHVEKYRLTNAVGGAIIK